MEKAVNEFAGRGFRSLGVARADEEGRWQFAGVLPLFDPPREQAKATIASARQMGVNVKMVTGDQIAIAQETSRQLGLGTNILDASGLGDTKTASEHADCRGHRKGRRLCAGFSGAQVFHRGCAAEARPHRRDDWRRGKRRARAQESRLRHSRLRCNGRRTRGSLHCAT